jgi:SAM-dependent methyltransferase
MSHDLDRLRAEYLRREQRFAEQDTYTLFNPANLFIVQQRQRAVLSLLRREGFYPLSEHRILEVGCGDGNVLREFLSFGAAPQHVHGLDLLDWRVAEAKALSPHLPLACADGQALPYPDGCFDLVLQYTVFTSILDDNIKRNIAQEMWRVLKPNGLILWYDYWLNPINPHAKGIRPAEVRALFPGSRFAFHRITLAPPVTRRLAPRSWLACLVLERLRIFNTHYLVAIRPLAECIEPLGLDTRDEVGKVIMICVPLSVITFHVR